VCRTQESQRRKLSPEGETVVKSPRSWAPEKTDLQEDSGRLGRVCYHAESSSTEGTTSTQSR